MLTSISDSMCVLGGGYISVFQHCSGASGKSPGSGTEQPFSTTHLVVDVALSGLASVAQQLMHHLQHKEHCGNRQQTRRVTHRTKDVKLQSKANSLSSSQELYESLTAGSSMPDGNIMYTLPSGQSPGSTLACCLVGQGNMLRRHLTSGEGKGACALAGQQGACLQP